MLHTISTGLIVLFLLASAWSFIFYGPAIEGVAELGFNDAFRVQLAIMKVLAAAALVLPFMPPIAKEWAYAGVCFFLITAIVAHFAHGDPITLNLINVALLGILAASYITGPVG